MGIRTDQEIVAMMRIPPWLSVTTKLRAQVRKLQGSESEWLKDGGRLFDFLVRQRGVTAQRRPTSEDLLAYLKHRKLSPGRLHNMLNRARKLLRLLDCEPQLSSELKTFRSNLVRAKKDGAVRVAAISDCDRATAITINDLYPEFPDNLGDAVERLACIFISWFAGRPQEGLQVPMRLIKRGNGSYFVEDAWSKTSGRIFDLTDEIIQASNYVATFPAAAGRHRIGVDADSDLPKCHDMMVPRLATHRDRIVPGAFCAEWLGRRLKRRVRELCEREGIDEEHVEPIVARISGKALRRGRHARVASDGGTTAQQAATTNTRTRNVLLVYSETMNLKQSAARDFLLGLYPAALLDGCR